MPIPGAHVLLYTTEPEAVREVFRDVFGWPHVDAGGGWLIFALPPAELGVHPTEVPAGGGSTPHLFSLMCDDIEVAAAELRDRGLPVSEPRDEGYGVTTMVGLPGGLEIQLYRPRHPTAT
ncbi:MAG TPA: VOC family protein [Acidimicrobiales bacterium]